MANATPIELVNAVKEHARRNYDFDGWDYVIETMDDNDIYAEIVKGGATTIPAAIEAVKWLVSLWDEQRRDIRGLSGELL